MRLILLISTFLTVSCGIAAYKFNELKLGMPYKQVIEKLGRPFSVNFENNVIIAEFPVRSGPNKLLYFDYKTESLIGMKDNWERYNRDLEASQRLSEAFQRAAEETRRISAH